MLRWNRILWFCPFVFFLLCLPIFPKMVLWGLFFLATLSAFYGLSLFSTPLTLAQLQPVTKAKPVLPPSPSEPGLPYVPTKLDELRALFSPTDFEVFCAALLVGLREGYQFRDHPGGSGDHGVDTVLLNKYRQLVVVQSKLYAEDTTVGSPMMREFAGSILHYHAAYGYLITTSRFTSESYEVYHGNIQIRIIDGHMLEGYLQWRNREIALAWREIQEQLSQQKAL